MDIGDAGRIDVISDYTNISRYRLAALEAVATLACKFVQKVQASLPFEVCDEVYDALIAEYDALKESLRELA